jgi:hypothetical protein
VACMCAVRLSLCLTNSLRSVRPPSLPPAQPPPPPQVSNNLRFIVRHCPASFATPDASLRMAITVTVVAAAVCTPQPTRHVLPTTAAAVLAAAASPAAITVATAASQAYSRRVSPRPCQYCRYRRHRGVLAAVAALTLVTPSSPRPPRHHPAGCTSTKASRRRRHPTRCYPNHSSPSPLPASTISMLSLTPRPPTSAAVAALATLTPA